MRVHETESKRSSPIDENFSLSTEDSKAYFPKVSTLLLSSKRIFLDQKMVIIFNCYNLKINEISDIFLFHITVMTV